MCVRSDFLTYHLYTLLTDTKQHRRYKPAPDTEFLKFLKSCLFCFSQRVDSNCEEIRSDQCQVSGDTRIRKWTKKKSGVIWVSKAFWELRCRNTFCIFLSWSFITRVNWRLLSSSRRLLLLLFKIAFWKLLLYSRTSAGDRNYNFNCQTASNFSRGFVSGSVYLLLLFITFPNRSQPVRRRKAAWISPDCW